MKRSIDRISHSPGVPANQHSGSDQPAFVEAPAVFSDLPDALWRRIMAPAVVKAPDLYPLRLVNSAWKEAVRNWMTGPCPPIDFYAGIDAGHAVPRTQRSVVAVTGWLTLAGMDTCQAQREACAIPGWNRLYVHEQARPELVEHLLLLPDKPKQACLNINKLMDEMHLQRLLALMKSAGWGFEVTIAGSAVKLGMPAVEQLANFILNEQWKGDFFIQFSCRALIEKLAGDPAIADWEVELADPDSFNSAIEFSDGKGKRFVYHNHPGLEWVLALPMSLASFAASELGLNAFRTCTAQLARKSSLKALSIGLDSACNYRLVKDLVEALLNRNGLLKVLILRNITVDGDREQAGTLVAAISRCTEMERCELDDGFTFSGLQTGVLCALPSSLPRLEELRLCLADTAAVDDVRQLLQACKQHASLRSFSLRMPCGSETRARFEKLPQEFPGVVMSEEPNIPQADAAWICLTFSPPRDRALPV